MMNFDETYLPINKIYIKSGKRYLRRKFYGFNEFYAIDTETYQGKCRLICDSSNRFLYKPNFEQILDFLMFNSSLSLYRAFYNLEFDLSAILKTKGKLSADEIKRLYNKEPIAYNDYILTYYPRQLLKIAYPKHHHTVCYTDLFNIYRPKSLNEACITFLNKSKFDKIDSKRLNTDKPYWNDNLDDIIYYCKMDARLTKELGDYFLTHVKKTHLNLPRYFTSFASLTKENFRYFCKIPQLTIKPKILDIAQSTYFGHRIELLKRGTFEKVYSVDINSAFPYSIAKLPSLRNGTFKEVDSISEKECIGFYKVYAEIPEDVYISPMPYRNIKKISKRGRGSLSIFPCGSFGKWITWYDAQLLLKFDCIKHIEEGFEYKAGHTEYYPFKKIITWLYAMKSYFKKKEEELLKEIPKGTMNASSGCFAEKHMNLDLDSYTGGVLYNPIYASIIPAETRYRLLKYIREKDYSHLIGFHGDSIISDKELSYLPLSDRLGFFSKDMEGKGIFINTGRYQIGSEVRKRGFSGKSLDWNELLNNNLNNDYIDIPEKHVISMKEALLIKSSLEDVNKFIERYSRLDINSDKKRIWEKPFKNCYELLHDNIDSKPKSVAYLDLNKYM